MRFPHTRRVVLTTSLAAGAYACGTEPTAAVDTRTIATVELSGCDAVIDPGGTCTLDEVQRTTSGVEAPFPQPVTWRSDNPSVATVRVGGVVTGVADGATTIHATVGVATASISVVVRTTVASVSLSGCAQVLEPGGAPCTMLATARSVDGRIVTGRPLAWSSLTPGIATVDGAGRVFPIARGHARIRAMIEGASADTLVAVGTPVYRLALEGCAGTLQPGTTCPLQLRAEAPDGQVVSGGAPTWHSSDPAVVTIDATGMVTARALGEAEVRAIVDGVEATTLIEVAGFAAIAVGGSHACGLKPDGRTYCWGRNDKGQLGDGTTSHRFQPATAIGGQSLAALALGSEHACGLTALQQAVCWGFNEDGQLGDGSRSNRTGAVAVSGGLFFREIAAGWRHTCAVATDDRTYCWGVNGSGTTGQPFPSNGNLAPVPVPGDIAFQGLVAGSYHNCALDPAGRAWCWGAGGEGELGHGQIGSSFVPVQVAGGITFRQLVAGAASTCGLSTALEVYCWGRNQFGQAGNGTTTVSPVPVKAPNVPAFEALAANGFEHVCGVTGAGMVWCWGRNDHGQLGDGTTTASAGPVQVGAGQAYEEVAVGASLTCARRANGAADCWGTGAPLPPMP